MQADSKAKWIWNQRVAGRVFLSAEISRSTRPVLNARAAEAGLWIHAQGRLVFGKPLEVILQSLSDAHPIWALHVGG